jgi:polyisoprenoid-binding protein YceI
MKQFQLFFFSLLIYSTSFAQQTWTVDNAHSNIRFEAGWEDFSIRTGEFKVFEGTITSDSKYNFSDATFYLKVDPKSLDVIAENLTEQLIGERFLDAENFPEIIYNSTAVEAITDSTYLSKGKITIHGVEKEQDAHVWVKGHKMGRRSELLGVEVSLSLTRKDFGLEWGSPRLGKTVKIVGYLLYQIKPERE